MLAAAEPILILARVTTHVNWALTAIHGSGIPIMTVDAASTDEEVGCQLLLLALWHGYIDANEDGLLEALRVTRTVPAERTMRVSAVPVQPSECQV